MKNIRLFIVSMVSSVAFTHAADERSYLVIETKSQRTMNLFLQLPLSIPIHLAVPNFDSKEARPFSTKLVYQAHSIYFALWCKAVADNCYDYIIPPFIDLRVVDGTNFKLELDMAPISVLWMLPHRF